MIQLSLPNKWLKVAARKVVATCHSEFRKRYRPTPWANPALWAFASQMLSVWVLWHSLPKEDWKLSAVAVFCFLWVMKYQLRATR